MTSGGPTEMIFPRSSTYTSSQTPITRLMSCSTRTTVVPSSASARSSAANRRVSSASCPAAGSSSSRNRGRTAGDAAQARPVEDLGAGATRPPPLRPELGGDQQVLPHAEPAEELEPLE